MEAQEGRQEASGPAEQPKESYVDIGKIHIETPNSGKRVATDVKGKFIAENTAMNRERASLVLRDGTVMHPEQYAGEH